MYNVKIHGAGSIGNHLAHACRGKRWQVTMCDLDPDALRRTREDIYPSRYGAWDDGIRLATVDEAADAPCDFAIVGTPPDTHLDIVLSMLDGSGPVPRVVLVEKPLCGPDLARCEELLRKSEEKGVQVLVGYNHVLTPITAAADAFIDDGGLGDAQTLTVNWIEHWGGIFAAHPWLAGPADSYLGHASRGGGACAEHSHGINIWQHFAHAVGAGRVASVSATLDMVRGDGVDYDRIAQLHLVSENGLVGYVVQDVVTTPARKMLRLQGERGAIEWEANADKEHDQVRFREGDAWREQRVRKTRPDDFVGEIDHVGALLDGSTAESPISLARGLDTMMVIAAAHRSAAEGRTVHIDYARGCTPDAIE